MWNLLCSVQFLRLALNYKSQDWLLLTKEYLTIKSSVIALGIHTNKGVEISWKDIENLAVIILMFYVSNFMWEYLMSECPVSRQFWPCQWYEVSLLWKRAGVKCFEFELLPNLKYSNAYCISERVKNHSLQVWNLDIVPLKIGTNLQVFTI